MEAKNNSFEINQSACFRIPETQKLPTRKDQPNQNDLNKSNFDYSAIGKSVLGQADTFKIQIKSQFSKYEKELLDRNLKDETMKNQIIDAFEGVNKRFRGLENDIKNLVQNTIQEFYSHLEQNVFATFEDRIARLENERNFGNSINLFKENNNLPKNNLNSLFPPSNIQNNQMINNNFQGGQIVDDPLLEESRVMENENILGNYTDGTYVLKADQNRFYFKKIRRIPTSIEINEHMCFFKKVVDGNLNVAFEKSTTCQNFDMEKFVNLKMKEIKAFYNDKIASAGKNHDYYYVMSYNKNQIQMKRHVNKGSERFSRKCFYLHYGTDSGDKFGIFIVNKRNPNNNNRNFNNKNSRNTKNNNNRNFNNNNRNFNNNNNRNFNNNNNRNFNNNNIRNFNNRNFQGGINSFNRNLNNQSNGQQRRNFNPSFRPRNGNNNFRILDTVKYEMDSLRNELRMMRSSGGYPGQNRPFY